MKVHLKALTLCTAFCILPYFIWAQLSYSIKLPEKKDKSKSEKFLLQNDDNRGLYIGANLGFYFANRHTAEYYNGSGINNVDSTINYSQNYYQIKQALNDYDFSLAELPSKMNYSPAFLLGIYTKYSMKNSGIIMQFNFARLRANDVFTLDVDDPNNYSSEPTYQKEAIWGIEQRASIDLGYSYTFKTENNYRPFFQFGANLTNTKFVENKIRIENLEYSITNYHYSYYKIEQGGVGFGGFLGGGVNLIFSESISIMPTLNVYYTQSKMGELTTPRFNYTFYISAILNGIL